MIPVIMIPIDMIIADATINAITIPRKDIVKQQQHMYLSKASGHGWQ